LKPIVLLVPSLAAAVELPRRLAGTGRVYAGLYPLKPLELARAVAEPALLGRGLKAWDTGHDALLAARLLDELGPRGFLLPPEVPRAPVATALARTLACLRLAGLDPGRLGTALAQAGATPEDARRLRALDELYRRFHEQVEGRFADPATLFRAAAAHLGDTPWLAEAEVVVADDLETDPLEREFLAALARHVPTRFIARDRPRALAFTSFAAWGTSHGITPAGWSETVLAPLAPPPPPVGLGRLRQSLFEPPTGESAFGDSVELLTAPGEAAEVRTLVRRLLREAERGVPFEEMGVILPRPEEYAPLFTDLLSRLGIPFKLHPSLPLRFGRCARSLLLLFRCRGLSRAAVMEFLTFAPVPFTELLGEDASSRTAQWDAISRDAGIVSGLERWIIGLRAYAELEREGADADERPERADRRRQRAAEADDLLRVVELLSATLDSLSGEASWPEWSQLLTGVLERWVGPDQDQEAVMAVLADLAGLAFTGERAPWREVEAVVEARFEWERLPLNPVGTGAVHVGALDAMAGLRFRVVAIPGLVEGGYPGVLRPDPFLLDAERERLNDALGGALGESVTEAGGSAAPQKQPAALAPPSWKQGARQPLGRAERRGRLKLAGGAGDARKQLSLFEEEDAASGATPTQDPGSALPPAGGGAPASLNAPSLLPTTEDRLLEARRLFHRALGQATERLILSYPRADPRSGRERLPSLFFAAVASALAGRPLTGPELERRVVEDDLATLPLAEALDRSERDRVRIVNGGQEAALAIASGSRFFRHSHLASQARWSNRLTPYDGLVAPLAAEVASKLDPITAAWPISASRLATFSRCGFQYLLQHVLRLEPALEPEERRRLDPLERGSLFHEVAERFLREKRDQGTFPVRDDEASRKRVLELAEERLSALVKGSPPRFTLLWEREKARFREAVLSWLAREAATADKSTPAHFELGFGLPPSDAYEPHTREPLSIDLGDGRVLRVSGKIDRIDRRSDGTLVLRDYKTGKAPRDDGGIFRGGKQLQIPFYILAAAKMFPDQPVVEAFLDYVDGGRQVALDPAVVKGETFTALLRGLVDAIAQGVFVQEPSACDWCDYTAVCGPKGLLAQRRRYKSNDRLVQRVLRLRDIG